MGQRTHNLTQALALILGLGACGTDPPPGEPLLEVGTGLEVYAPIADGDTLGLECGSQGSQHVWVSIRTRNLRVDPALVGATLRTPGGEIHSLPLQLRLRLTPSADGAWRELVGIQLPVPEPPLEELVDLEVWVEEETGDRRRIEEVVSVELIWATRPCIR